MKRRYVLSFGLLALSMLIGVPGSVAQNEPFGSFTINVTADTGMVR